MYIQTGSNRNDTWLQLMKNCQVIELLEKRACVRQLMTQFSISIHKVLNIYIKKNQSTTFCLLLHQLTHLVHKQNENLWKSPLMTISTRPCFYASCSKDTWQLVQGHVPMLRAPKTQWHMDHWASLIFFKAVTLKGEFIVSLGWLNWFILI